MSSSLRGVLVLASVLLSSAGLASPKPSKPLRVVVVNGQVVAQVQLLGKKSRWVAPQRRTLLRYLTRPIRYWSIGLGISEARRLCFMGLRATPARCASCFDLDGRPSCKGAPAPDHKSSVYVSHRVEPHKLKVLPATSPLLGPVIRWGRRITQHAKLAAPRIVQAFATDLDGDHRREIVVTLGPSCSAHDAQCPHFSAVVLVPGRRRAAWAIPIAYSIGDRDRWADGRKATLILHHRIAAIADIDWDGSAEIVLDEQYGAGGGAIIARYERGRLRILTRHISGT